jgi:prepilin-type N-terminal cleavage/methylation domain-containing protein
MKSQQSGFTLVEIAIVLVIIGLLLGGILKGQELINSAKVKALANDFRAIPTYVYAYQDKFRGVPGDHASAETTLTGGAAGDNGNGNGLIEGAWNDTTAVLGSAPESRKFWRHVRLANLAAGPTDVADTAYTPKNAMGGFIGINSVDNNTTTPGLEPAITGMTGTYQICSVGITGNFAKQLDIQMDDGNTATGSLRTTAGTNAAGNAAEATAAVTDGSTYTVCMTF